MTTDVVSPDLTIALRRLKLSGLLNTLPERLALAQSQKMPYQGVRLGLQLGLESPPAASGASSCRVVIAARSFGKT